MICRSCRTGMLSRLQQQQAVSWTVSTSNRRFPIARGQYRSYSDSGANPSVAATPPPSTPRQPTVSGVTIPSAISSATPGVSQPFSTPDGVHTEAHPDAPGKTVSRAPSSCPAGTKMNGLNYFRNKPDVFAKEDSEYPDWLWGLAKRFKQAVEDREGWSLNKKQRKRYEKKLAARTQALPPKIPAHHHAFDITPASYNRDAPVDSITDATEGLDKRQEVTRSARRCPPEVD
ncbi:uncharacterized protein N7477_006639 [Penicillium maclennaniae]|uniref:uncharacterized protein n=1 Tax=Penicillium maclennaniae TaxID=1343394 RepID=UPI00254144AB|nr:uncharacterized protein N7477_006639 [Penicillium maclennaniae]KAJ5668069.1 hypothetical protein N7477_006639 [Penicillium maclennaniae]